MDTAAGFARYLTTQLERLGTPRQLLLALLVLTSFVVTVAVASLLVSSPDAIVVAPFRW